MNKLLHELMKRKQELQQVIDTTEKMLISVPQGYLRTDSKGGVTHFYHVLQANTNGKYIPKENVGLVEELAHKEYAKKLNTAANNEMKLVNKMLNLYSGHCADDVYGKLNEAKRHLNKPILLDDDTYARLWQAQTFDSNPFYPDGLLRQTRRGEMVRSKTETFQANVYFELGIPYRYECALKLRSGNVYYPDFTLLDKRNRRVIYHEHLGLLDDEDYRRKAMIKLAEYERNGIYVGKNLILTSESPEHPFNPEQFRKRIRDTFRV